MWRLAGGVDDGQHPDCLRHAVEHPVEGKGGWGCIGEGVSAGVDFVGKFAFFFLQIGAEIPPNQVLWKLGHFLLLVSDAYICVWDAQVVIMLLRRWHG